VTVFDVRGCNATLLAQTNTLCCCCCCCRRMNKIHDYGGKLEDPSSLGGAMTGAGLGGYGA
jgi:hypothetical protein